jgi:hypothetical protein
MLQVLLIFGALYGYRAPLTEKIHQDCHKDECVRIWVYFTDKGVTTDQYADVLESVIEHMPSAAYERRAKRNGAFDYADIPLYRDYIHEVEARGGMLIHESKWLNAASFWAMQEDLDDIAACAFVYKITPVAKFKQPQDVDAVALDSLLFGLCYRQLDMFNIIPLHEEGFFGSNVRIGILDTGLRRRHAALDAATIVAEYDFLGGDRVFVDGTPPRPLAQRDGFYGDMVFHKSNDTVAVFVTGDTLIQNVTPARDIMYTVSYDSGVNWEPMKRVQENLQRWARELSVTGADSVFIFYRDRIGLKYLVYDIANDVQIVSSSPLGSGFEPSAIYANDSAYVVYVDDSTLYLRTGTVSGFTPTRTIDVSIASIKSPKAIANSSLFGVFYHTIPGDSVIFLRAPFTTMVFERRFLGFGTNIDAVVTGDTICVAWQEKINDVQSHIVFATSHDFGTTFSNPIDISDTLLTTGKVSVAKSGTTVTVMWETSGTIFFTTSSNNGSSFSVPDTLAHEFAYLPTLGTGGSGILKFYCTRGDTNTDGYTPEQDEYFFPRHGTEMLGLIGGYLYNTYVGVAPGAEFVVAKTENPREVYEFPVEEDALVVGLEWCEAQGCDITNSSLGYAEGYIWPDDYDGKTSPASIALTRAAERGMINVTAAGNVTGPRIMIPGDAEGAITVGGIDTLYNRWEFSGYIDTPDDSPRKPEFVCLSAAPVVVNPDSTNSYLYSFGTSSATALVSGICALLLEGHPNWNVDSVKHAIGTTAFTRRISGTDTVTVAPSDSMGYGWPNAYAAFYVTPPEVEPVAGNSFLTPYPNPFTLSEHDVMYIPFKLVQAHSVELRIYSLSGRLITTVDRGFLFPGEYTNPTPPRAAFTWDGTDDDGEQVASGVYYCVLLTRGGENDVTKIAVVR